LFRILLALLLSPALPALAQEFPSRPITMVVPFSAGGPGDVIGRLLGSSMSHPETANRDRNVVGAGGTIGTNRVAKAAPDGYTVLLMAVARRLRPRSMRSCRLTPSGTLRRSASSPTCP
jgi:tripartite-type tricarboxylate transporter receptor subunit TctC